MQASSNPIKNLSSVLLTAALVLSSGASARADTPASNASPATTAAGSPAPSTKEAQTTNLGEISVTAMKELVKTLQVVKVALDEPYSDSRDKADVVVCRIIQGHGHLNVEERMGAVLECGTNSWFTWQHERCRNAADMAACASDVSTASAYKRKDAWHSMRALNLRQVQALRKLLTALPPPGKGEVVVVDEKTGKTIVKNEN